MTILLSPPRARVQVHASTLLVLDGYYLAAWFSGSHEGAEDCRICLFDSRDFSVRSVFSHDVMPQWNPVLALAPNGIIWLFFKRGWSIENWTTWFVCSADGGRSWSEPSPLIPEGDFGGRGPVRQAPIAFGNLWVSGGSREIWSVGRWDCFIDISPDFGRSWKETPLTLDHSSLTGAGCIQPALVKTSDDELVVFARSTEGVIFTSRTKDPYRWPPLAPGNLPNNNSGIAAVALPDDRIVMCHNSAAGNWGARSELCLSCSSDGGTTWERVTTLAIDKDASSVSDGSPQSIGSNGIRTNGMGEYSYPSIQLSGDRIWVTYSWQRQSIALEKVPLPPCVRES